MNEFKVQSIQLNYRDGHRVVGWLLLVEQAERTELNYEGVMTAEEGRELEALLEKVEKRIGESAGLDTRSRANKAP